MDQLRHEEQDKSIREARRIAICVGKDRNRGLGALRWAIEKEFIPKEGHVYLLHVLPQVRFVPNPMGGQLPVDSVSPETLKRFKEERLAKTMKRFDEYIKLCKRHKITFKLFYPENDSIPKKLVNLISEHTITDMLLEKSPQTILSRIVKGESISSHVCENAPGFCKIVVIRNGKLYSTNDSRGSDNGTSFSPKNGINSVSMASNIGNADPGDDNTDESEFTTAHGIEISSQYSFSDSSSIDGLSSCSSFQGIGKYEGELKSVLLQGLQEPIVSSSPLLQCIETSSALKFEQPKSPLKEVKVSKCRGGESARNSFQKDAEMIETATEKSGNAVLCETEVAPYVLSELFQKEFEEMNDAQSAFKDQEMLRDKLDKEIHEHIATKKELKATRRTLEGFVRMAELAENQCQKEKRNCEQLRSELREHLKDQQTLRDKLEKEMSQHIATKKELETTRREAESAENRYRTEKSKCEQLRWELEQHIKELEREQQLRKTAEEKVLGDSVSAASATSKDDKMWWHYSFKEIQTATENFHERNKLGQGRYGQVYKGVLRHTSVAVKVLAEDRIRDRQEFQKKLEIVSRLHHPNLVLFLGACPDKGCLIYEYIANGNLEERLYCEGVTAPMPWFIRFRICLDVARALSFLHTCPQPIVYQELKLRNVLLDHGLISKITDIHMAELIPMTSSSGAHKITESLFTRELAYIDPDYQRAGTVTCEADVYSLGILILQLLTKRPPLGIAFCMEEALESGQLDRVLDKSAGEWPLEEATSVAQLGLKCMEPRRKDRAKLKDDVLPVLESVQKYSASLYGRQTDSRH
ncbi:hypothetical protein KP509_15G025800 [Ceratopteris richardii]|uniref:RING-type E3 ubiquitin transferase n=1 Tax=Ceratopteris richardii TaxID=49495 RepID=A0A8T2T1X3_CERRI|nr:hypothetical protein KP509_15G025800 [Ceratopteris richardii]